MEIDPALNLNAKHRRYHESVEYSLLLRLSVVFAWLSCFYSLGVLVPLALYILLPGHRFVRWHSFLAVIVHLTVWVAQVFYYVPALLFVIELQQQFITPVDFLGQLFAEDAIISGFLLLVISVATWFGVVISLAGRRALALLQRENLTLAAALRDLLIALLITPAFFYVRGLWGSNGPTDNTFLALNLEYFKEPAMLLPGHAVLVFSVWQALIALRSRRVFLGWLTGPFLRLEWARRSRGLRRYRHVRLRNWIWPGAGQAFDGHWLAGLASMFSYALGVLFLVLSAGLWYGHTFGQISAVNANATWFLLEQLGLKPHGLTDQVFDTVFSQWWVMLLLVTYLFGCQLVAWWDARLRYFGPRQAANAPRFWLTSSQGLLLHLIPVAIALLIPITVNPFPALVQALSGLNPSDEQLAQNEQQPIPVIPEFFDPDQSSNTGIIFHGDPDAATEPEPARPSADPAGRPRSDPQPTPEDQDPAAGPGADPGATGPEKSETQANRQRDSESVENQKPPGKREKQNYSSYLSIRIRSGEKADRYWPGMPVPYHAVFEYTINGRGRLHSVRVLEGSGHPEADQVTVDLIQSLDPVLAPPGNRAVIVRELFWNTHAGDSGLPTERQRRLSTLFDGREILPADRGAAE
ncbi:MAG: hypothetical protein KDK39_03105 [Leptospiraceae bacterium]|nr:hypothetical protein [Leptospiraceae bacterium]